LSGSYELGLHPKALHHRLAIEGTTFGALVDNVWTEAAERYLRDTDISLSHLARELGYAEQSVLTRSCRRWFGTGPAGYRRAVAGGGKFPTGVRKLAVAEAAAHC
jgi:AraC-like DNA-binding protein